MPPHWLQPLVVGRRWELVVTLVSAAESVPAVASGLGDFGLAGDSGAGGAGMGAMAGLGGGVGGGGGWGIAGGEWGRR